ncbi:MAG: prolyl oligopeptidase family serine peptidase [Planctomycetota bacterium]
MRRLLAAAIMLSVASCATSAGDGPGSISGGNGGAPEPLTVDRLLAQPSLVGTAPRALAWAPDGARLAFLWADDGTTRRQVWTVEADGAGLRARTDGESGVRGFAWTPDGRALVLLRGGALWRLDLASGADDEIARVGGASTLRVSPDGRFASYLRDGDLWLVELASGDERRVTQVAVPSISTNRSGRYSRPDVEIGPYVWGGPSYAWSPDGRSIAVHHVDRRGVREVPFPDYLADETAPNPARRPYPGDANERRSVGIVSVDAGTLELVELADPTAYRVVDFAWSPGGRLLVDQESDTAVERRLYVVDGAGAAAREIWRDTRASRVYTLAGSTWHPDGRRVLVLGDLDDRYGLYVLGEGAGPPVRLSNPAFDVTSVPSVAASGAFFFQSNEPSPRERHVYRVGPEGGAPQRVTQRAGEHRAYPSPDGARAALLFSSDDAPTELYLTDSDGTSSAQRITRSQPPEFDERPWANVRYVTFPSHTDGATLHARILEPRRLEPGRRYPVLFGPMYSNTVRNRFGGRYALIQQMLVERGYVVVQVDVRGSTGYGRAFREAFLCDFAGQDLEDVESAVRYVRTFAHVDPERFGIWGSSYGGTLTVYAMLKKPGLFQAGVAAAAAVDPRFFGSDDVAIVRRPESRPDAFERDALRHAEDLEGALLLIHGMQDQVVPFKTVVALADALMRAGKDFDFAFAPGATHGWTGRSHEARYLLTKLVEHFDRHLGSADRAGSPGR